MASTAGVFEELHEIIIDPDSEASRHVSAPDGEARRHVSAPDGEASRHVSEAGIEMVGQVTKQASAQSRNVPSRRRILKHMRFDKLSGKYVSCWSGRKMKSLPVEMRVDRDGYQDLSGTPAPGREGCEEVAKRSSCADTGASVCCSGTDMLQSLGINKKDLLETEVNLFAADRKRLTILGVIPVIVASRKAGSGKLVEVRKLQCGQVGPYF